MRDASVIEVGPGDHAVFLEQGRNGVVVAEVRVRELAQDPLVWQFSRLVIRVRTTPVEPSALLTDQRMALNKNRR